MKKISLIASGILLTSQMAFAESITIDDAFKNGKVSGDTTLFFLGQNNNRGIEDSSSLIGWLGLNYSTDSFYGITLNAGFVGNTKLTERVSGDYEAFYANQAILSIVNIAYENDNFFAIVGRQEIDLEWLSYNNEAALLGVTAIPNTTIIAGYVDRGAEIAYDVIENFTDRGFRRGLYVLDAKTSIGIEGVEINPYYYRSPDIIDFYGLKVSYDNSIFGITGHYVGSNVDQNFGQNDEGIVNIEARFNMIENLFLAAGYIDADKDAGATTFMTYGNNITPLEDENNAYSQDARTWYIQAEYNFNDRLNFAAVYGSTDYINGGQQNEKQLNIGVSYDIIGGLSAEVLYVNNKGTLNDDYDKVLAGITYSF